MVGKFVFANGWMKSKADVEERRWLGGFGVKKFGGNSTFS